MNIETNQDEPTDEENQLVTLSTVGLLFGPHGIELRPP